MIKSILVFTLILTLHNNLLSQDKQKTDGTPIVGWDSLKSMIGYPEIAKRAGIQGFADVEVQIDSTGTAQEVNVTGGYNIFVRSIQDAVKKVKWYPSYSLGNPHRITTYFQIEFQLKQLEHMPKRKVLIIKSDIPVVRKEH